MTSGADAGWSAGPGEMAGRIRAHDWAPTPLGPAEAWPQSLRTTVGIVLGATSPLAIFWGPELVLLYNDAWRELLGDRHPWALGRPFREVFPESWDVLGPIFAAVLAGQGAVVADQPLLPGSAHMAEFSVSPIPKEDGSVGGLLHMRVETPRRRRAEAALREREAHDRLLFDSIDEGFCVIEVLFDEAGHPCDYRFLEVNAPFERQTGLIDVVGRRMRELAPDHEAHWFETYGRIARTGVPERFELPAAALGRHYDVYAFRIGEPHENKVAVLFNDVSRRKRVEQQLRERMDFEQQLIGIVSHDLRQPLQSITLSAASLLRNGNLGESEGNRVTRILTAGERMGRMLSDLLDFTQARLGGGIALRRASIDLGVLAERVADEARVVHPARVVELSVAGNVAGAWDGDRLSQVLTNLVSNALSYSPAGTPVVLTVRGEESEVVVRVHNEGAPIPPDLLARLFEPLRRGTSPSGLRRSIGLGLFIVDHVVRAHGGSVEVQSTAEDGTTFTVRIPRA